jgi:hypothetical protein
MLIAALSTYGQGVTTNWFFGDVALYNSTDFYESAPLGTYSYTEKEKLEILEKQYLHSEYHTAKVDQYTSQAYLRFNLFNGQMEFTKGGTIYYLKKEKGRTVRFPDSNELYKVYKTDGELEFMKVAVKGTYSLLVKQSKRFIPPKKRTTSYGHHIKATFKRNKDLLYVKLADGNVVRVPSKKSEFFALFGKKTKDVKAYMKKNKLGFKKLDDLKKVVAYLNS